MQLLYIGTFNGRNIDKTILGFSTFKNEFGERISLTYHIIGNGTESETDKLQQVINECNLNDNVILHGYKSHTEIRDFFDQCNIGVSFVPVTSWYNVQPPTKTFEYLCSGLVVIATNTFENSRVITNENGTLIEDTANGFYQGLKTIYNNRSKYDSGKISSESTKYTWKNIVSNHIVPGIEKILTD